jgi:hypothetical protein
MTYVKIEKPDSRISQGDIFENIEYIDYALEKEGDIEIAKIIFPYVCVLTQDCDLAQDYNLRQEQKDNQDKILISVLVAPMYNYKFVLDGTHLDLLDLKMQKFNGGSKTAINNLVENNNPRYHYLNFSSDFPELLIDFKHYFTLNRTYLESVKDSNRRFKLKELYRENVSQRFSSFLSRIGLPD